MAASHRERVLFLHLVLWSYLSAISSSHSPEASAASAAAPALAFQLPNPFAVERTRKTTTASAKKAAVDKNDDDRPPFFGSSWGRLFNPTLSSAAVGNTLEARKRQLLEAVSFTDNGKSATPEQQAEVLSIVRALETDYPPSPNLLTDTQLAKALLDGPWFLQYTSPGQVGDPDRFPNSWKPQNAQEGSANIETTPFQARGSVSAAGVPVETANRVVVQTIDVDERRVTNDIGLEWGRLVAGGTFRPSSTVPNRALVSFDTFQFQFNVGFSIDVGFLFPILKAIRRSQENGWLETTFVDKDVRIGRGNKGTMFVLTRRQDAVQP